MAVEWRKPTIEEARFFAACLEACLPGELAIEAVDAEIQPEVRVELARRWEEHKSVRAARFDIRRWVEQSAQERMDYALTKTRNGMAVFLATHNVAELQDTKLTKALKFMEALEKVVAGTAGKGDASSQFFADVLSGKVKLGAQPTETVQ